MQNQTPQQTTEHKASNGVFAMLASFASFAPFALCAGTLLWAIEVHPLWFYTLTRWIVLLTCIWYFILTVDNENLKNFGWASLAVAVVFNPVIPFQLTRQTWQFMDAAAAAFVVASAASLQWAKMPRLIGRAAIAVVAITMIYGVWRANDGRPQPRVRNPRIPALHPRLR